MVVMVVMVLLRVRFAANRAVFVCAMFLEQRAGFGAAVELR
jgi:hypothetical protein